jgi:predicted nuclease of predicted toxin-antitoxin system
VKLPLDGCVWGKAAESLRAAGHDVVWVGDWADDPGDDAILAFANMEQRILSQLIKTSANWLCIWGCLIMASCEL